MKTIQDYRNIYRGIASNLGLQGDSVELLVQLLAQASYINEVENVSYVQESSLEKATLPNSKIQKCMDTMYSVFRGACPRVILRFRPTKYFSWNLFDEIVSSNNFRIYYLGYLGEEEDQSEDYMSRVAIDSGFIYAPITIPPSDTKTYTIVGLLASEYVEQTWTLNTANTYYVDCTEEGLSEDMWVKIDDDFYPSTRHFSDHILNSSIFDLTLTTFGSRLYVADIFKDSVEKNPESTPANTKVQAHYFKYSTLSSYNTSELSRISIKGIELQNFDPVWLAERGYEEITTGVIVKAEEPRDTVLDTHYKASRDRYLSSVLRSNSDLGRLLEEMYPGKVYGTTYKFEEKEEGGTNLLNIAYIPKSEVDLLSTAEISEFIEKRKAYYITNEMTITKGLKYTAILKLDLELFSQGDVSEEVKEIVSRYENIFNLKLAEKEGEIKTLISKISGVKQILGFDITYINEKGETINGESDWNTFYNIPCIINTTIQSKI